MRVVIFFVLEVPDFKSSMLIYLLESLTTLTSLMEELGAKIIRMFQKIDVAMLELLIRDFFMYSDSQNYVQ